VSEDPHDGSSTKLEPHKPLITGSLGWLGFNGDATFNILIRTIFLDKNKLSFPWGGNLWRIRIWRASIRNAAQGRSDARGPSNTDANPTEERKPLENSRMANGKWQMEHQEIGTNICHFLLHMPCRLVVSADEASLVKQLQLLNKIRKSR